MFEVLRDSVSGICRVGEGESATVASQVSVLRSTGMSCHWLTATPNPQCSVFKPFVFCKKIIPCVHTESPSVEETSDKPDRRHSLYKRHEALHPMPGDAVNKTVLTVVKELEDRIVEEMENVGDGVNEEELSALFKDSVESEMKFYAKC